MSIYVLDVETTQKNPQGFSASPHHPDNRIVLWGSAEFPGCKVAYTSDVLFFPSSNVTGLVGHNIGFDLAYVLYGMWRNLPIEQVWDFIARVSVWDTGIAEYMIRGQHSDGRMLSLADLAEKHCVPFIKDETVAEHFTMNLGAESVEPELLKKYLIADVEVTGKIAQLQMDYVFDRWGKPGLVYYWKVMSSRVMTTLMEMNGLCLDATAAAIYEGDVARRTEEAEKEVIALVTSFLIGNGYPMGLLQHINPASTVFMGAVLFGGTVTIPVKEDVLVDGVPYVYKGGAKKGQVKTRTVATEFTLRPYLTGVVVAQLEEDGVITKGASGRYGLDSDVLKKIEERTGNSLVSAMIKHRAVAKEMGMVDGLLHQHNIGGYVHTHYHHNVTGTTRLSSSGPNLQNISNKGESDED